MKRNLDLTLRGICDHWPYGPLTERYADTGVLDPGEWPAFWEEIDELIADILDQTPRRTTTRIKLALQAHRRAYVTGLEYPVSGNCKP